MKTYSRLVSMIFSSLFLLFSVQMSATAGDAAGSVISVTEGGACGHNQVGKLQFLQNSDQSNAYEVTVKTIKMQQGNAKETEKSVKVNAGEKKHLGCSLSSVMPLTSYTRTIVNETKSS